MSRLVSKYVFYGKWIDIKRELNFVYKQNRFKLIMSMYAPGELILSFYLKIGLSPLILDTWH